jgi:predicted metal-dependent hydrolase
MFVIDAVASGALFHVRNGNQFGSESRYDPAASALLAECREMLHVTARAAVAATR